MVVLSLIHENLKWCANLCWNADLGKNSLLSILLIPPSLPSAFQLVSPSPCSLLSILLIPPPPCYPVGESKSLFTLFNSAYHSLPPLCSPAGESQSWLVSFCSAQPSLSLLCSLDNEFQSLLLLSFLFIPPSPLSSRKWVLVIICFFLFCSSLPPSTLQKVSHSHLCLLPLQLYLWFDLVVTDILARSY